jgi:hypothetical protein
MTYITQVELGKQKFFDIYLEFDVTFTIFVALNKREMNFSWYLIKHCRMEK